MFFKFFVLSVSALTGKELKVVFSPLSNTALDNIIRCSGQHVTRELRVEWD
jgi:hypothetical protein